MCHTGILRGEFYDGVGWASVHRNTLESRTEPIPHPLTIMGKEWFLCSIVADRLRVRLIKEPAVEPKSSFILSAIHERSAIWRERQELTNTVAIGHRPAFGQRIHETSRLWWREFAVATGKPDQQPECDTRQQDSSVPEQADVPHSAVVRNGCARICQ